ncbi:MAG: DUF4230 domain-containing protein [Phycisphaerae bacterium]
MSHTCSVGRLTGLLLWLLLAAAVVAVVVARLPRWLAPPGRQMDTKTTLSLLKSEAMTFLVTRRVTTQIVVEHSEGDWLSDWRGVYWAEVTFHYGIDLEELDENDVRRDGEVIVVHLPEPRVLDFAIVPASIGWMSKATAVAKIDDLLHNGHRRLLEQKLREQALAFARRHDQMPTRQQIADRLNSASAWLHAAAGVEIHFK